MNTITADRLADYMPTSFPNPCEAKHEIHYTKAVDVDGLELTVFDWEEYKDTNGFCPGDDAVSQSIELGGGWERHVTDIAKTIFEHTAPSWFIDIGAHIGWYTTLALCNNYNVIAVEPSADNRRLLASNAEQVRSELAYFNVVPGWIDKKVKPLPVDDEDAIRLIKIDIEGNEQYAIKLFQNYFERQLVDYLIMEVSPVFNNSYEKLINQLLDWGYEAFRIDPQGSDDRWWPADVKEKLAEFPQIDMFFQSPRARKFMY